jgi:2,3-bisphosphoglycerate-dependent phosphoglycerate mutase
VSLSDKGKQDCFYLGNALKDLGIKIDVAIHTKLSRTKETLDGVCQVIGDDDITVVCEDRVTERDYGEYTGQDKWKMKDELGEEQWLKVRRGWDVEIPNGESLKDVYNRVVPAYQESILPLIKDGKNVLVVGHGNSFRALMKYIESIPDDDIEQLEMMINQIVVYEIDPTSGLRKSGRTIVVDTPTGKSQLA